MKNKRPINLDLSTVKFPLPSIVSILHRASGVVLFLFIPFALWLLHTSLATRPGFYSVQEVMQGVAFKFVVWVMLSALLYHLVAGIRHLLMDLGMGDSLIAARVSAKIALVLAIILIVLAGVWLW